MPRQLGRAGPPIGTVLLGVMERRDIGLSFSPCGRSGCGLEVQTPNLHSPKMRRPAGGGRNSPTQAGAMSVSNDER